MAYAEGETYFEEGCAKGGGLGSILGGNGDRIGDSCTESLLSSCGPRWSAGVEFTLLRPHFENDSAFTTLTSDGDTFETFTDTSFAYDRELAPRIWLEAISGGSLGMRAIYWRFDHGANPATGTPPANGFGRVSPPTFGNIDLSSTIPGSQFSANSDIDAYTIDLELTKTIDWGRCGFLTAVGLRYAEIAQNYSGSLQNAANTVQGTVNFAHDVKGLGPTIAIRSQRPFTQQLSIFGSARGALVYGDGSSTLTAIEDQDLDTRLTTNRATSQNDFIPIGEMQVGMQWTPNNVGVFFPYMHIALESQLWSGVGNASSTDGNLGFFGFNVAIGFDF